MKSPQHSEKLDEFRFVYFANFSNELRVIEVEFPTLSDLLSLCFYKSESPHYFGKALVEHLVVFA